MRAACGVDEALGPQGFAQTRQGRGAALDRLAEADGEPAYRRDTPMPDSARAKGVQQRYMNERGFAALEKLEEVGRAHDATIAQTAIAWCLANPAVTSAIIGATSLAQLEDTVRGAEVRLSAEEKEALDAVTAWEEQV